MDDARLPPPAVGAADAPPAPLPWEDPSVPATTGLFETLKLILLRPQEAFNRLTGDGLGRPFFYSVIMAWVELFAWLAWTLLANTPFFLLAIPELDEHLAETVFGFSTVLFIGAIIFVLMPVLMAIGLFIHTCILHLMMLIVGEGKRGIETTFRVLCYSHSADVANIIPACGGVIAAVWFVVLQVIGLAEAHRCSYGKSALAVFLPLLLCCGCLLVLFSMGVGSALVTALSEQL
jgi:hypothetical protein